MSKAKAIFTFDDADLIIQCTTKDNMRDICQNFSTKSNKDMNSFSFLYEGNPVNFELSFNSQANKIDRDKQEMKILVYNNGDEIFINNNKNIGVTKGEKNNKLNEKENNEKISNNSNNIEGGNYSVYQKNNLFENIESREVIENLFSCLNEKVKLKIIKYNKDLQKSINISLINYKFLSGKYIIYEENGIGKEYYGSLDDCIFEGEYVNGERNGKGKEYNYDGKVMFEGEYLNGQRNGKGKEYYYKGKLRYEGEYLNGEKLDGKLYNPDGKLNCDLKMKIGLIKEYNDFGILVFEGEYLNGQKNGKGKKYYDDGKLEYEDEYLNGKKWNGKRFDNKNKLIYELKDGNG